MKKNEWLKASDKEKAEYLLSTELKVKKQVGILADSKVGDNSGVLMFCVFAGIIQISNWQESQQAAMGEAIMSLDNWKKKL